MQDARFETWSPLNLGSLRSNGQYFLDIREMWFQKPTDSQLERNVVDFGISPAPKYSAKARNRLQAPKPRTSLVPHCSGDSHTATPPWAFGAKPWDWQNQWRGVFATQTIWQVKPKKMLVEFTGTPHKRDLIQRIASGGGEGYGVACGVGYVVEYRGEANWSLDHGRTWSGNMSIEFGSKMGSWTQMRRPLTTRDANVCQMILRLQ